MASTSLVFADAGGRARSTARVVGSCERIRWQTEHTVRCIENLSLVAGGAALAAVDPARAVARVLRAHRNAADNILPFAVLGLLFVLWGAMPMLTAIFCGVFVVARLTHSFSYLGERQPWRTVSFGVGALATLVMVGFLVRTKPAGLCVSVVDDAGAVQRALAPGRAHPVVGRSRREGDALEQSDEALTEIAARYRDVAISPLADAARRNDADRPVSRSPRDRPAPLGRAGIWTPREPAWSDRDAMKSSRSSYSGLVSSAFTVAVLSLAMERVALADETEAMPPSEAVAPVAPVAPATEPAPMPALPEALPPVPAPAPVAAAVATPAAVAPAPASLVAPSGDRDVAEPSAQSFSLLPWEVDVRGGLHTTPVLEYGGVGASADAGMRKLGPGTLALGGGIDYFVCGTTCSSAPLAFTQRQLSFEGRVSYHLSVPKVPRVDVYPLATAGLMSSRSSIKVGSNSEYRGSDLTPTVSFGAGASYFFAERFFVGAEARFRYAAGSYSYELASGPAKSFDRSGVDRWSASTVDLSVAVGARF